MFVCFFFVDGFLNVNHIQFNFLLLFYVQSVKYYVAAHGLSEADEAALYNMNVSFDGGGVEKGLFIDKATDHLQGVGHGVRTIKLGDDSSLVREAILLVLRSNTDSNFRFPVSVFGVESMNLKCFAPKLKKAVRSIKQFLILKQVRFFILFG